MTGPLALALIGLAAAAVALAGASLAFARRPADAALAAGTLAVAFVFVPVYVLGWAGALERSTLLAAMAALAVAALAPIVARPARRARLVETARAIAGLARDGLRMAGRTHPVAVIGVVTVLGLCAYTAGLAYLAPSTTWDGLLYHEPTVGFALQRRGFAWLGLDALNPFMAQVDGFPHLVESLSLAIVAAWDRRLIELPPSLLLPLLLVALYVALRRFVRSPTLALAFAAAAALLPALVLQLRSTLVDVGYATFFAASLAWVARPRPRPSEIWMLGLSLGLLGAAKVTGAFAAPVLGLVAIVALARDPERSRRRWAHAAGAALLALTLMAPTYARNLAVTGNPLWPARIEVPALGLELPGRLDIVDMNLPVAQTLERVYTVGARGRQRASARHDGYGHAPPLILPALALLGLLRALRRAGSERGARTARVLLAITLPMVAYLLISPARQWARLNLHVVLALFLLAAYGVAARRHATLAHLAAALLILGGVGSILWSQPAWGVTPASARDLFGMSPLARVVHGPEEWSDSQRDGRAGNHPIGSTPTLALAREQELGPGDRVIVARSRFVGLLWNERMDNVVEHLEDEGRSPEAWIAEAERRGAVWAVARPGTALADALAAHPGWASIGPITEEVASDRAFRRRAATAPGPRPRSPPAPPDPGGDRRGSPGSSRTSAPSSARSAR